MKNPNEPELKEELPPQKEIDAAVKKEIEAVDASDNSKLKLWQQLHKTNKAFIKDVTYGRKYKSIDAQYKKLRATHVFGPYGMGFGLKNLKWDQIVSGGKILEITLDADFWYKHPGIQEIYEFPMSVDMVYKPGNDTRKKMMTDCLSKALSNLGGSADVYLGLHDDDPYTPTKRSAIDRVMGDAKELNEQVFQDKTKK